MSFVLGDIIVDRLQFGYGAKSNGTPLYALTNLSETTIDISADSTDVTDAQGNLVYRKYTGKSGEVNGTNAFINLAVIETLSATDAEIATADHGIEMPIITTVKAGEKLDITNYVSGTVFVSGLNTKGSMGVEYTLGTSAASDKEYFITTVEESGTKGEEGYTPASATLELPTNKDEVQYIVKYQKTVYSGAKITNSGDKYPKNHELFFKALVVDKCDTENFRAAIIHIPSFTPSPEFSLNLSGGDNQNMDFKGAIMLKSCSTDKELFSIYYIDEIEDAA
jgi:predicted secreted protein